MQLEVLSINLPESTNDKQGGLADKHKLSVGHKGTCDVFCAKNGNKCRFGNYIFANSVTQIQAMKMILHDISSVVTYSNLY